MKLCKRCISLVLCAFAVFSCMVFASAHGTTASVGTGTTKLTGSLYYFRDDGVNGSVQVTGDWAGSSTTLYLAFDAVNYSTGASVESKSSTNKSTTFASLQGNYIAYPTRTTIYGSAEERTYSRWAQPTLTGSYGYTYS